MDKLAEPAIKIFNDKELQFVPDKFDKNYLQWLENIRDWCISRQLWWGHQIPAYYCQECGEVVVAREMPEKCPKSVVRKHKRLVYIKTVMVGSSDTSILLPGMWRSCCC